MVNKNDFKVGTVISIPERASGVYKVVDKNDNYLYVKRCKRCAGWPLADCKTVYKIPYTHNGLRIVAQGTEQRHDMTRTNSLPKMTVEQYQDQFGKFNSQFMEVYKTLFIYLSPENLSWDGERPRTEVEREERKLMAIKKAMDDYIGYDIQEC